MTRHLSLIKRFVELGTPLEARRADGKTPLLLAVDGATDYWYRVTRGRSHPSLRSPSVIVGFLLALGADYNMSAAAAVGDLEQIERILKDDPDAATRLDSSRTSPLSRAAEEGYLHIVKVLLEQGADPDAPEAAAPNGLALFNACRGNHLQIAQLLLDHGANPNAGADSCGCCLTIGEVYHGKDARPLQRLLRQYGASTPPYCMSVAEMQQAICDGQDVVRDEEFLGNLLKKKRHPELLNLYLDSQSGSKNAGSKNWLAPFSGMGCPRSPELIQILLSRGFDPDRPDWLGRTALHACGESGDRTGAAAYLAAGADINARDFEFRGTALAAAVRSIPWCRNEDLKKQADRQKRMVQFLLKQGAATNLPGDEPWATPLAWARKRNLPDMEAILIRHGAK